MKKLSTVQEFHNIIEKNNQKKSLNFFQKNNTSIHCTNCGTLLEEGDLFCDECGSKIDQEISLEEDIHVTEYNPITISSDRIASILETNRIKNGESIDEIKKNAVIELTKNKEAKELSLCGYYVRKDSNMTQYLIIESVQGNNINAQIKTMFTKGGYSTEFYEGTFFENEIHLRIENSDLHPPATEFCVSNGTINTVHYEIQLSENFDGVIDDNVISGSFKGQFSKTVEFRRI